MESETHPPISIANRQKRLEFANKWLVNGENTLGNVMWTDESKFSSHPNGLKQSYWVPRNTPRSSLPVKEKRHSNGFSVMVWGSFHKFGKGPLVLIEGTMNGEKYVDVLKKHMLDEYEDLKREYIGDWKLMQDNAPCHTARIVKQFLSEREVSTMIWPPYSPDLNPIENLWPWMKRKLLNDYDPCQSKDELWGRLVEIWNSITPELCMKFCGTYENRLKAVILNNGHGTKY